ncbi:platelet-activating factor acetylhydrolase, isoform II domain-containing protein [Hirsutella rhossiliensis]|uniref:Putative phospholipase n=1 Tax=Hirsutella rhossiliensis TaxID=111463 RepID=A0A9P8SH62_9HYPO|nr:platelet-activating factor acetylhydrolase, isoform II domain-containing protein [Hirsutella rhossiliensis]KAH0961834.1 platelet-activating factor acetylhydrolase, isoform II domain-containing protein [Hirsutella rhossiliensis]
MSPDSDLELDSLDAHSDSSLDGDDAYAPDSPLATATSRPQARPRWLQPRRTLPHRVASALRALCLAPRPHHHHRRRRRYFSRRRLLLLPPVIFFLYALVRLLRGQPLLATRLPASYSGPHRVGAIDVEVPASSAPRTVTDAGADVRFRLDPARRAFELETVLVTLYYPVAAASTKRSSRRRRQHFWLDRPIGLTAAGYARLAHFDYAPFRALLTVVLWAVAGSLRIPADVDGPLLQLPDESGGNGTDRLPVVVFSHGMASSRTDYTHYLAQLASRGYVVAALEHRDGSCPGSLIKPGGQKPDRRLVHFSVADVVTANPSASADDELAAFKKHQLAFRTAEIAEAVALLRRLDDGHGARIHAANSRAEGSSLPLWKARLDLGHLVIAGHSYGATGALQALGRHDANLAPSGGIVLDPGKSSGPLNNNVSAPLLIIHSDAWSRAHSLFHGRPHFATVRDLARAVLARTRDVLPGGRGAAWFLTSLGVAHPSVSDAPLIEPLLLRWATRTTLDARDALRQYVDVSAAFLDALGSRAAATGLLAEKPTHDEYGVWVSPERKDSFPKDWAGLWEIHVSPADDKH